MSDSDRRRGEAHGPGSTRPGVRAPLPEGIYEPAAAVAEASSGSLVVEFEGEDLRRRTFDFAQCPLPGWHQSLAAALAQRVGPSGGLRTGSSSLAAWKNLRRFLMFLADRRDAPARPEQLLVRHVEAFRAQEVLRLGPAYAVPVLDHIWRVLRLPPIARQIGPEAINAFRVRSKGNATPSKPGYSDGELQRLLAAARADVSALRDRLLSGNGLLDRLNDDSLAPGELAQARQLALMVERGADPAGGPADRYRAARQLFVTRRDVAAMLVLLVAVTGRNIETIKELPAEHRLLNDAAVEVRLTKRRRGAGRWFQTVTWEIGPAGRALDHPGGLYLLLHKLMAGSRELSDDRSSFWAFWRNLRSSGRHGNEHGNPFRTSLTAGIDVKGWAAGRDLRDDAGQPLKVEFNRLRTSIEARRTRKLGGHLPSAARSNTTAVLFSNYLRDDPTVRDWAQEVTSAALSDAEQAALDAHHRRTATAGTATVLPDADDAGDHGPWSTCRDIASHPATGKPCRATFLDCFHCGNCLITPEHLPRLLALLDALAQRRQQLTDQQWWARYGPAWAAIRHDILPRFTPAEVHRARSVPWQAALLDLVENPWNRP